MVTEKMIEAAERLKQGIADADADKAQDHVDAQTTGDRPDLHDYEVCLNLCDAKAILAALSTGAEPVAEIIAANPRAIHFNVDMDRLPVGTKLYTALSAQVQDVADTETYYTTENNWENMFFGNGASKTEMDLIWDFGKQNWANADFKIIMTAAPAAKLEGKP